MQCRRPGFDPWVGKIPWRRASHCSILAWRIPKERGAWWAAVHGVAKRQDWMTKHSTAHHYHLGHQTSRWTVFSLWPCSQVLSPLPLICSSSPNSWTFRSPSSYCRLWLKIPLMSMRGQSDSLISPLGCV